MTTPILAYGIFILGTLLVFALLFSMLACLWIASVWVYWNDKFPKLRIWAALSIAGSGLLLSFPLKALSPVTAWALLGVSLFLVIVRAIQLKAP